MTATVESVVAAVQDISLTITGVRIAPDTIPDKIETGPTIVTFPESGVFQAASASWWTELHTIASDVIVSGGSYAQAYKAGLAIVIPFVRAIIAAPTLGGTVQTFESVTYGWDRSTLIWTVRINGVKILT